MAPPSVPVLCPRGTVLCVATGPSLTAEDVDVGRSIADLVIGVNDAARLFPVDVAYSSDLRWWEHYQGLPTFTGHKYGIRPLTMREDSGVTILGNTGDAGIETDPTALRTGRNSGYAAINLAVHLGATRIVLLGYDMQKTGGRSHFFGEHPGKLRVDTPFPQYVGMFRTAVEPLRQLGVTVINCSRATALDAFPRQRITDLVAA